MNLNQLAAGPCLNVGGRLITDLANLKILRGNVSGANSNCTLRDANTSAGYQVPVGKKFVVVAYDASIQVSGVSTEAAFCYSDNDVGMRSGSAFTNPVYEHGVSQACGITFTTGADQKNASASDFEVPAGKYPGFRTDGAITATVTVYGYEQSV